MYVSLPFIYYTMFLIFKKERKVSIGKGFLSNTTEEKEKTSQRSFRMSASKALRSNCLCIAVRIRIVFVRTASPEVVPPL